MAELLGTQPYIASVALHGGEPIDVDLDAFRAQGPALFTSHLAQSHWDALGLPPADLDLANPWLFLDADPRAELVVCRTGRRIGSLDWGQLRPYAHRAIFLGFPEEHQAFVREFIFEVRGKNFKIMEVVPKEKTVVPVACKFA